ncbi:hypothetical protein EV714DRAFT_278240 [Schizophyllum commune]
MSGPPTPRGPSSPPTADLPQQSPAPPTRPKPKPVRRSARNQAAASSSAAVNESGGMELTEAHTTTTPPAPPAGVTTPPAPVEGLANVSPSLAGIPIDPALLRLQPPYTQITPPTLRTPSQPAPLPSPAPAPRSPQPHSASLPVPAQSSASLPPSTTRHSPELSAGGALPDVPPDAPEWFSKALSRLRVDLGSEWARLLHAWVRYEGVKSYGQGRLPKTSRLDVAGCRPKEVAAWIGGGRWRSEGCEPAKKEGKFACALMNAWWAWYIKLVPGWREEDEEGRLEDFTDFGVDAGKLDVPGVNGVLSLVFSLKWVGQALNSDGVVDDRVRTDSSWRRAIVDLTKMLDGLSDL